MDGGVQVLGDMVRVRDRSDGAAVIALVPIAVSLALVPVAAVAITVPGERGGGRGDDREKAQRARGKGPQALVEGALLVGLAVVHFRPLTV